MNHTFISFFLSACYVVVNHYLFSKISLNNNSNFHNDIDFYFIDLLILSIILIWKKEKFFKPECALRVNFGICISVDCAAELKYNYTLYVYIKLNQIIYQIQIVYQFVNHNTKPYKIPTYFVNEDVLRLVEY